MALQATKAPPAHSAWYAQAMERLVGVVEDLSHTRSLEDIMAIVRRAARDLTGADGATFVLRDDDKCFYAEENAISPLWKGQRFPLKSCVSGWAMLNKQPAIIEDIYVDPRIPVEAYRPTFVKSLAMVPIRREEPVGAIGNYWAERRMPLPEEIAILQALANVTAVAIENVELYRRLEEQVKALQAKNEELKQFTWIASHDLKSPLRSIANLSLWAEQDAEPKLNDASQAHLKSLRQRCERMDKLLDDLAAYSALGRPDESEDMATGADILTAVMETVGPPQSFRIEADDTFRKLNLPRFDMERVFANLIDNAVKHHDQKTGTIKISATEAEDRYTFRVADDGPGVPPEFSNVIFKAFQTLKPRDKVEGSGMGLAIVRRILAAHGDDIRVESQGRGATFVFTWRKPLNLPG